MATAKVRGSSQKTAASNASRDKRRTKAANAPTHNGKSELWERLRFARDWRGLHQKDLSDALGLTRAAYAFYEHADVGRRTTPNAHQLQAIAAKLKVPMTYLASDQVLASSLPQFVETAHGANPPAVLSATSASVSVSAEQAIAPGTPEQFAVWVRDVLSNRQPLTTMAYELGRRFDEEADQQRAVGLFHKLMAFIQMDRMPMTGLAMAVPAQSASRHVAPSSGR